MTVIYPGSFDPVTRGHTDIIERAARFSDLLVIAILDNPVKQCLFTVSERAAFLNDAVQGQSNIRVEIATGLLADFAKKINANILIRGVRNNGDLMYESSMAHINRKLTEGLETLFLLADPGLTLVSGSIVRETAKLIYANGHDDRVLDTMVAPGVKAALRSKFA